MHRTRRRRLAGLLILAVLATGARAELRDDVEAALRQIDLGAATIAISVVEAGPGTPLVSMRSNEPLIPASNLKLLTTGAALHGLGPDFAFRTRLVRRDRDLIVVGDGDPAFGDPTLLAMMGEGGTPGLDVAGFVGLWTDAVAAAGITDVERILVDDRIFDREFVHPSWPRDQLNRRYCAQVSGFCFHLNQMYFFPEPRPNQRPFLEHFQPAFRSVGVRNNATSRSGAHDGNTLWIARPEGTNDLAFYGNVKTPYRVEVPVTVHDMPALFARLLADHLRDRGVIVRASGTSAPEDGASTGESVGPVIFTPIGTAVTRCNRDSQNLYADCLLKRLGHAMTGEPGSWINGAAIVRGIVHERLGTAAMNAHLVVADGSGLSRLNRVEAETLTAWLNSFHNDERLGSLFIESLAVGGASGTLEKRLGTAETDGAIVQAKSGYINGVSCLSGYVTRSDGRRRCFSIMINDLTAPVSRAKMLQDRIVRAIALDMHEAAVQLGSD